jgi:FkbM family methyltransferase
MRKHLLLEHVKRWIRVCEARIAWGRTHEQFRGINFSLVKPYFWDDTDPANFAAEILPYFEHMPEMPEDAWVIDAGAATGQFTVAFALTHPRARIVSFEPSRRQRILTTRNLAINHAGKQCTIEPFGLWNDNCTLAFRTHGAISSLEQVSELAGRFPFTEKVAVMRLDDWAGQIQPPRLNLIKMDIEGAELEAIQGMKNVLARYRPALLVQAYHIREGARTLERCVEALHPFGYACREIESSGLLVAVPV